MGAKRGVAACVALLPVLTGCAIWPVNQDPDGIRWRQHANQILFAVQDYHTRTGTYPRELSALVPGYLRTLPKVPRLSYDARNGSLAYHYIPSFPQLRWTWCQSIGDTTNWRCAEHLLTGFKPE